MTTEVDKKEPVVDEKEVKSAEQEVEAPQLSDDEVSAQSKGWQTKDDWVKSGKPEDEWKPAKVFNEIGSLKDKLAEKDRDLKKSNKVVELMKKHHIEVREAAVKQALEQLRSERKKALEEQDFSKAEQLRDNMDDLKEKAAANLRLPREVEQTIQEVNNTPDPSFQDFRDRNPWYKTDSGKSDEMSRKADALGFSYSKQNPDWAYDRVLKEVEKDIRAIFPDKFGKPGNPVNESGTRGSGQRSSTEKVSLSADEKAVARSFGMSDEEYAKELKSYRGR